ncbi:unnamed protein product [Effrenium voratum]|nr:unnamed protein product [Effrenium voratum]
MRRSLSSNASLEPCESEAKLLKLLQNRRSKSQLTPSNGSVGGNSVRSAQSRLSGISRQSPSPATGVSAAFLVSSLVDSRSGPEATRAVAATLRQRGVSTQDFESEVHPLTGGRVAGPCRTHVAHAWDASYEELIDCIVRDAGSDLDRRYSLDVFGAEHLEEAKTDPVAAVQALILGVQEVLLVLDKDGLCLSRLWVLAEAMMAISKLRVSSAVHFSGSEAELLKWEACIDAVDWAVATSRKADERRLRTFAERVWDMGIGTDRLVTQLKVLLRKEVYGQILLKAVEQGDVGAIEAALQRGAPLEQRDVDGNTLEDLACFYNHPEIEEMLFQRRMQGMAHRPLSMFFKAEDLLEECGRAHPEVLMPFLTQPIDGTEPSDDESDEEAWQLLASLQHPFGQLQVCMQIRLQLV